MAPNIIKNSCAALSNDSYLYTEDNEESEHGRDEILPKRIDSSLFTNHDNMILPASNKSLRTFNPIRAIVDPILRQSSKENPDGKQQISLALGDPTAYGNFTPCPAIMNAMMEALQSPTAAAGYVNACGTDEARESIANYYGNVINPDQVIVANGCSGALEIALTSLLDDDTYLLVPCPAFPLYEVIVKSHGANIAHYNLLHDKGWECDLNHLEQVICDILKKNNNNNKNSIRRPIRGIMINNPGNPTGSVFSEEHLIDLLHLSQRYHIPIISDEIYCNLTYGNAKFQSIIQVASKHQLYTPLIVVSGIGKQFLVPGWRVGWTVFYDEGANESLKEIEAGAKRLAQVILGASHLAQCAIPAALKKEDDTMIAWKQGVLSQLEEQSKVISQYIQSCNGLSLVSTPQGAMYCMVRIHIQDFTFIKDDVSFVQLLLKEENVLVLPGQAFFGTTNDNNNKHYFFRVVFCAPKETLIIAMKRLIDFCQRHCTTTTTTVQQE